MFGVEMHFTHLPWGAVLLSRKQLNTLQPHGFPSIAHFQLE